MLIKPNITKLSGLMHPFSETLPKLLLLNSSNLLKILLIPEQDSNQEELQMARLLKCPSTLKTNTLFVLLNIKEVTLNIVSYLKEHLKKSGPDAAIFSRKEEMLKLIHLGKKNSKKLTSNSEKMEKEYLDLLKYTSEKKNSHSDSHSIPLHQKILISHLKDSPL